MRKWKRKILGPLRMVCCINTVTDLVDGIQYALQLHIHCNYQFIFLSHVVHCRERHSDHGILRAPSTSANTFWQLEKGRDPHSGKHAASHYRANIVFSRRSWSRCANNIVLVSVRLAATRDFQVENATF